MEGAPREQGEHEGSRGSIEGAGGSIEGAQGSGKEGKGSGHVGFNSICQGCYLAVPAKPLCAPRVRAEKNAMKQNFFVGCYIPICMMPSIKASTFK